MNVVTENYSIYPECRCEAASASRTAWWSKRVWKWRWPHQIEHLTDKNGFYNKNEQLTWHNHVNHLFSSFRHLWKHHPPTHKEQVVCCTTHLWTSIWHGNTNIGADNLKSLKLNRNTNINLAWKHQHQSGMETRIFVLWISNRYNWTHLWTSIWHGNTNICAVNLKSPKLKTPLNINLAWKRPHQSGMETLIFVLWISNR